jgi:hypothetical protein
VANTLAFNDTGTITAVKSFIELPPGRQVADLDDVEIAAEVGDGDEKLAVGVEAQADPFLLFLQDVGKHASLVFHITLIYSRILIFFSLHRFERIYLDTTWGLPV